MKYITPRRCRFAVYEIYHPKTLQICSISNLIYGISAGILKQTIKKINDIEEWVGGG